jgi:NAD(P)-dependent dehydrogenase (short-subunit alcohol dehydrogenase family)
VPVKQFRDRVAVVTGGASGIGRAMAAAFCRQGMRVVIGDVEQPALDRTVAELRSLGGNVIGALADVCDPADVEALRDRAVSAFGSVHLVCNNAGIGTAGAIADTPLPRWRWALDVNLMGVVHGCRAFLPLLTEQQEGHIVNTASIAGLSGHALLGAYTASKFAVVGLSECLHHELAAQHSPVRVSVFCPGPVATSIRQSERNRPPSIPPPSSALLPAAAAAETAGTMPAAEAAQAVLDGIRQERFYIFTHPGLTAQEITTRHAWMLASLPPPSPPSP